MTGAALAGRIAQAAGANRRVKYAATVAEAIAALVEVAEPGDVVMTLGAGSVSQIAPLLLEALKEAHASW